MKIKDTTELEEVKAFFDAHPLITYQRNPTINTYLRNNHEVLKEESELSAKYGISYCSKTVSDETVFFQFVKDFPSRAKLLEYCATHELVLPKEVQKSPNTPYDGKVSTRIMYTIRIADDLSLVLYYERDGLPSKSCRIVTETTLSIACDIDGNKEANVIDEEVPF